MRILLAVQLLLSIACDPPASEESSAGGDIVGESTEQFKAKTDDLKDLNEELAKASVPVSAGYLTFKINKDQKLKNIDAYVVGSENTLIAETLDHETFTIKGIPTGEHDVIITGLLGDNSETHFDHGIKMTKSIPEDGLDLGDLLIPKAGSLHGKIAMGGVSPFNLLELKFPGTKIGTYVPLEDGSFSISHLPVGTHEILMKHAHNPKTTTVPALVEEAMVKRVPRFSAYSKPNQPTNLIATEQENGISLSWSNGGASTSGFVIARSEEDDYLHLNAGRIYREGDQAGVATIIAIMGANQVSYVDQSAESDKNYIYSVFAVNKDQVYSLPASYQIAHSGVKSGFSKYRLHIYSSASSCYGWRTTAIQSIRFNFEGLWQTNNFSAETMEIIETGKDSFAYKGTIGPYSAIVSTNNLWGVGVHGYDAFYAFQHNSSAWSSAERVVKKKFPYEIKKDVWITY
ncbi:hypothetical protein [Pseudobacteriovorax antillogorgiicola]|uniref:Uncharacterized protein n=1 Tax=Pseudobacteriovorax antillogorgiicola TaxID=1513793 RepID=A0A1Y6CX34_9BACT|nr:hypothetical protein [Pseudobacteriovorax antillogorgiicola]TCS43517.1 hypothetical protein EDD56_13645 [Pseudobacteriovorax antillogorgiicola]SMF81050.1 hypothetical protein SAMN06296036_1361 [Pseudobacteriovorax antillogorgiicola]